MESAAAVGVGGGAEQTQQKESRCFFEKKNQKTFGHLDPTVHLARPQRLRSFLLLFFKKEVFCSYAARRRIMANPASATPNIAKDAGSGTGTPGPFTRSKLMSGAMSQSDQL